MNGFFNVCSNQIFGLSVSLAKCSSCQKWRQHAKLNRSQSLHSVPKIVPLVSTWGCNCACAYKGHAWVKDHCTGPFTGPCQYSHQPKQVFKDGTLFFSNFKMWRIEFTNETCKNIISVFWLWKQGFSTHTVAHLESWIWVGIHKTSYKNL